jgi:ubiquinol-cytochrome c reductase cytochrome c subunit
MRARLLAPVALVGLAATLGIFVFGSGAGASPTSSASAGAPSQAGGASSQISAGAELFAVNCSSCHGATAEGSARAPNLQGLGGATYDLWLSAGWMPLAEPTSQPEDKPPRFPPDQIAQIVAYLSSLTPGVGPAVPSVDVQNADVATGFDLFALNCAGCHTITGAGDALSATYRAPTLHGVHQTQVYEAIITGPQNMPDFSGAFTPQQVNDIVAYVTEYIQHPTNPGGLSLGGVGPVAEGFVGLFAGVGACMLVALWIGDRTERDDEEENGHGGHEPEGAHA